ncbi:MAG: hypothetical protein R8P61_28270 [Bacteroidia bacterium]|nr:hypothetical protein [Bacteroidia bacterium]
MSKKTLFAFLLFILIIPLTPVTTYALSPLQSCEPPGISTTESSSGQWIYEYAHGGLLLNLDLDLGEEIHQQPANNNSLSPRNLNTIKAQYVVALWGGPQDVKLYKKMKTSSFKNESKYTDFNKVVSVKDGQSFIFPTTFNNQKIQTYQCGKYSVDDYLYHLLSSDTTPHLAPHVTQAEFTELMTEFVTAYETKNDITNSEIDMTFPAIETEFPFFYRIWQQIKSALRF